MELVRYLLTKAGHRVTSAIDGRQALDAVDRETPDIVITDLQMPEIDGYELLNSLRGQPRFRSLVIVALTAYSMAKDKKEVLAAGFNGYISKPIEPESFVRTIETFLPPAPGSTSAGDG